MTTLNTADLIKERLNAAFAPSLLDLRDDSAAHAGHAGAASGGGHFHLRITASAFAGASRVSRHRLVYHALGDLMQQRIHALSIDALAPNDTN
jgi:BolA family transcriptional regulator, general stress-responsive regulator